MDTAVTRYVSLFRAIDQCQHIIGIFKVALMLRKKIVDFGAFIELPGGVDGLLHISKISDERISRVQDVLSEGDEIKVEILEFKGNKISLGRAK